MANLTKQCRLCKEIKDVSEFYKKMRNKDRLAHECKKCCYKENRRRGALWGGKKL